MGNFLVHFAFRATAGTWDGPAERHYVRAALALVVCAAAGDRTDDGGAAGGAVVGAARVDRRGAVEPRRGGQGRGAGQEALSGGLDLLHS